MADLNLSHTLSIRYQVDGDAPSTFLLFNGASLPLEFWDPVVERLADKHRVIRFDARNGHGSQFEGHFSLLDTAADVGALLDHLEVESVIAAGHAWGGRAAQVFARDYPHRLKALAVCGTGGQFPARVSRETMTALRDTRKQNDFEAWCDPMLDAYCHAGFRDRAPDDFVATMKLIWELGPNAKARWDASIAPSPSYWGTATVPVSLLYGTADLFGTPENAKELAKRLPDAELIFTEEAGHFIVREQPEFLAESLLAFAAKIGE
ncbi:MAG: alpha/beta hydrolase [Pseudomonadota bacterium]